MIEIGPSGVSVALGRVHAGARLRIGFRRLSPELAPVLPEPDGDERVVLRLDAQDRLGLELRSDHPWAVMIGSGGVDLITGQVWSEQLTGAGPGGRTPWTGRPVESTPQNYVVVPGQRRLDQVRGADRRPRPITVSLEWLELLAYPMDPGVAARRTMTDRSRRLTSPPPTAGHRPLAPITPDPYGVQAWDQTHPVRCTIRLEASSAP